MDKTSTIALSAILTACSADVTTYQADPLDGGSGGADAAQGGNGGQGGNTGCELQADCSVGDGIHDICYEYKAVPLTACVLGETLPCDEESESAQAGTVKCGPFGWCDFAAGHCQAEGASTCVVNGELENCEQAGEVCCETSDGAHGCSADCEGTVLEP